MRKPRPTTKPIGRRPDGSIISCGDLPDPRIVRWTRRIKITVIDAIDAGIVEEAEACFAYALSAEELAAWRAARDCAARTDAKRVSTRQARRAAVAFESKGGGTAATNERCKTGDISVDRPAENPPGSGKVSDAISNPTEETMTSRDNGQ